MAVTEMLDEMLKRLARRPTDRRLDQLEPAVWARIDAARRAQPVGTAWGWRTALAVGMLTLGMLSGGIAGAASAETSPFSIHAALAPATLIEGGR
jgi:hypothetical protein